MTIYEKFQNERDSDIVLGQRKYPKRGRVRKSISSNEQNSGQMINEEFNVYSSSSQSNSIRSQKKRVSIESPQTEPLKKATGQMHVEQNSISTKTIE